MPIKYFVQILIFLMLSSTLQAQEDLSPPAQDEIATPVSEEVSASTQETVDSLSSNKTSPPLAQETYSLTVRIVNAVPDMGSIEVSLFDSNDTFLMKTAGQQSGKSNEAGEFTTTFNRLAAGEYAVVVVHDENDNQLYDSGFLGFGAEGLGYSNNVRPWFGRPDFEDAKIVIDAESLEIEIKLN